MHTLGFRHSAWLGSKMLTRMLTWSHASPEFRHLRSSLSSLISTECYLTPSGPMRDYGITETATEDSGRSLLAVWGCETQASGSWRASALSAWWMTDCVAKRRTGGWFHSTSRYDTAPFCVWIMRQSAAVGAVHRRSAAYTHTAIFHSRGLSAPSVVGLIDELIMRELWGRNVKTHCLPRFLMPHFLQSDERWITCNISDKIYKTQRCSQLRSLKASPVDSLCFDWLNSHILCLPFKQNELLYYKILLCV